MERTENYRLSLWGAADEVDRTAVNGDMMALDEVLAGKGSFAVGVYTGDGTTNRTIVLGFKPRLVILSNDTGMMGTSSGYLYGGMAAEGAPLRTNNVPLACQVTENGFQVVSSGYSNLNSSGSSFRYAAFQ